MFHDLTPMRQSLPRIAATGGAALAMLTTLAGCGNQDDKSMVFPPACPITHIPSEAADYYLYANNSANFRDLIARASITKLQGDCFSNGPKDLKTRIVLRISVERGPAATTNTLSLPWFVAVLHGDKIVNKHVFHHMLTFPPNLSNFQTDTKVVSIDLPIVPKNVDSDYRFEIGFQLDKDQLDYNKVHLKPASYQAY